MLSVLRSLKHILQNPEHRTVISNTASLSGLQVANTLLPLVTIPYVVRVIGPQNYGSVAFAQAFATYFVLLVNYGFDLSASREVARVRDDTEELSRVFWSVLWTKVALLMLASVLFGLLVIVIPRLHLDWQLMLASYLILIGYVAFPTWFFQGIEKLGFTAVFNFVIKLVFTAGIFIFLQRRDQFILVPVLGSSAQIVAGCVALAFVRIRILHSITRPEAAEILGQLRRGWTVFISTVFMNFYTTSNTVILGFFAAQENVGYFAAAAKIVIAGRALILGPITQAMYPHVGKLMKEEKERGISYVKKMTFLIIAVTVPASLAIFASAPFIVRVFLGKEFLPSIVVLRIMSPFPFLIGVSNVLGIQGLLNLNQDRPFFGVIAIGSAINLILNFTLAGPLEQVGTALSWLITELYISVALLFAVERAGIRIVDIDFYRGWLWERGRRDEI